MYDAEAPVDAVELRPADRDAQAKLMTFWLESFLSAKNARQGFEDRWYRYDRLFNSHITRRAGDWRSKVFVPLIFYTVQTILPRLVAQLPKPVVYPVGPEDDAGAKEMEELLDWSTGVSDLYLEIVKGYWSALVYGTGILKTYPRRDTFMRRRKVPVMEPRMATIERPVMDPETGMPLMDLDDNPVIDQMQVQIGEQDTGRTRVETEEVEGYLGPAAKACDIFDIFPSPGATEISDASYLIYRVWVERDDFERRVSDGIYKMPEHLGDADFWEASEDAQFQRLSQVDLGGGRGADHMRRMVEIWECWRKKDNSVTTIANRKAIVRAVYNPFDHGRFPFIRIIDHLNPNRFWGTGEVEHLEGIQDLINALWNQRIDAVRLAINKMFFVDDQAVVDLRELRSRPGGVVRLRNPNGLPLDQLLRPLDLGEVNSSAYTEAAEVERLAEKVSGVSAYQTGTDSPSLNDTATGVAIISEQGNNRFALKVRLAEMTGLKELMRQYGALLQQFTPEGFVMRIIGPDGSVDFKQVGPEALAAALDYDIEAESSTVTESVRKEQSMSLLQLAAQYGISPVTGQEIVRLQAFWEDLMRDWGKKDLARYMAPQQELGAAGMPGMGLPPELAGLGAGAPMGGLPPEMAGGMV